MILVFCSIDLRLLRIGVFSDDFGKSGGINSIESSLSLKVCAFVQNILSCERFFTSVAKERVVAVLLIKCYSPFGQLKTFVAGTCNRET